jgi:galactose-1-phosphate uridylyltransferase
MLTAAARYKKEFGKVLFDEILKKELVDKVRIVTQNETLAWHMFRMQQDIHLSSSSTTSTSCRLNLTF